MSKKKTQKIIIPKGTIDPNEDTLIEIPNDLKDRPVIVAQKSYKEKTSSTATSVKNVEFGEHSAQEDYGKIRTGKEGNCMEFFSPKHNSSIDMDKMQSTRQEFKDIAFLGPTGRTLSQTKCQYDCAVGTNESFSKARSSALTASTVCDKSFQYQLSKPQTDVQHSPSSIEYLPLFAVTPKSLPSSSQNIKERAQNITAEADDKCISFKEDKNISAACLDQASLNANKRQFNEDKTETLQSDQNCNECCKKSTRSLQRALQTSKASCSSEKEDKMSSPERLRKLYKYPNENIDDVYIEQLQRQFDDARRKLEDAIILASMSLKQLKFNEKSATRLRQSVSGTPSYKAASICDSVPEKDICFLPVCRTKTSSDFTSKGSCFNVSGGSGSKIGSPSICDAYKSGEIYKNIVTKRPKDLETSNKYPIQLDIDNPCPFLKVPNLNKSMTRSYKPSKEISIQTEHKIFPSNITQRTTVKYGITGKSKDSNQLASSSTICPGSCSSKTSGVKDSTSMKFVKEPRCNFTDNDSLVGKTSTLFK